MDIEPARYMFKLNPYALTEKQHLTTEVEHRTTFTTNRCEFSIFETHRKAENVKLRFGGFTITSMLRGKKVIHGAETDKFDYIPGQTLMLPDNQDMIIDFPDARYHAPTQCTALVIDNDYLQKQLDYINEQFPKEKEIGGEWKLHPTEFFLRNDENIVQLGNKIIKIFSGTDPLKDILLDLKLKELLLSIIRLQNLRLVSSPAGNDKIINDRFKAVVEYIRNNASNNQLSIQQLSKMAYMSKSSFYRAFAQEFGISPNQMLLIEKINHSKALLANESMSVKDVSFAAGFSDPNYFCRMFKKVAGCTPGEYRLQIRLETN